MDLAIAFVYAAGAVVCHQLPERSFFWGDRPFPVCARCTGLYAGGLAGLVGWWLVRAYLARRPSSVDPRLALRVLVIAAVPTAISLATGGLGVWDGSNITRALLALPLGVSGGAVVAAVASKDLR